jgi:hypothetical protein
VPVLAVAGVFALFFPLSSPFFPLFSLFFSSFFAAVFAAFAAKTQSYIQPALEGVYIQQGAREPQSITPEGRGGGT